jgi:hypothetical protein
LKIHARLAMASLAECPYGLLECLIGFIGGKGKSVILDKAPHNLDQIQFR